MSQFAPVQINNQIVYIEVEKTYGSEDVTSVDNVINKTEDMFHRVKSTVTNVAASLVEAVQQMDDAVTPDEFTFQFSLKLSAEGNVILTKLSGESQFQITMKYSHKKS